MRGIRVPGGDRVDLGERLVGLAAVMERRGANDHRIETVGLQRRRIVDQRGATFDQSGRRRARRLGADDRRLGRGLGADRGGRQRRRGKQGRGGIMARQKFA